MANIIEFEYPSIPDEVRDRVFGENQFTVVAVIGKSLSADCNKMDAFELLDTPASLRDTSHPHKSFNGRIIFYVDTAENLIYLHFETTFDDHLLQQLMASLSSAGQDYFAINALVQSRFAKVFMFAASVCHLMVLTDPGTTFDNSYLSLFRALSSIREHKFLKYANKSEYGKDLFHHLGKELRLCAPKMIFLFERPDDMEDNEVEQHEIDMEHEIYGILKGENLLSKNTCLFVLPKKLPFVHVNRMRDHKLTLDPVKESMEHLMSVLSNYSKGIKNEENFVEPQVGYGRPFRFYSKEFVDSEIESAKAANQQRKHSLKRVIRKHVKDILASANGSDREPERDGNNKSRPTGHRPNMPSGALWLEIFEAMHEMLLGQEQRETPDPEYTVFMDHFNRLIDTDGTFFRECCDEGFKKALKLYELNLNSRSHYSQAYHLQKLQQSYAMYLEYARGPKLGEYMEKLKDACDLIWVTNRQLCESLSLRGNPCMMPKMNHNALEHTSGVVFISTCNCGRTQARREDPYLVKQANYDFYQMINCAHCITADRISFPVFQPSINDYCAANISISPDNFRTFVDDEQEEFKEEQEEVNNDNNATPLTQQSQSDLSYEEFLNRATPEERKQKKNSGSAAQKSDKKDEMIDEELNEIVVKVGEIKMDASKDAGKQNCPDGMLRQPSTTEYLPGMVTTMSPAGLLPQFPSWSLMCIGRSLIYSHNTGIQEHFQGKFLSGANLLLPWNVHVRLEHMSNWTANYERSRNKKQVSHNPNVFQLKIFIGMEYECPKGHRFIMSGPDKIMQSSDLTASKNVGSKVAYNDMPLYYPCRCQAGNPLVAQLMRVHIVTPKAPVNVIVEPKVRIGNRTTNPLIFTTGLAEPVKLTQSDYWILRLPYVYQTENPILPPTEVDPNNAVIYGCLLAGMFGIVESEEEYEL